MVLSVTLKREYIPTFNDNQQVPSTEQIRIIHKAPTIAVKEALFPRAFKYGVDGKVYGEISFDRYKILKEFILDIQNLAYTVDGEKEPKKIKTVDDLFNAPPEFDPLIDELYGYFQGLLNAKVDEKK